MLGIDQPSARAVGVGGQTARGERCAVEGGGVGTAEPDIQAVKIPPVHEPERSAEATDLLEETLSTKSVPTTGSPIGFASPWLRTSRHPEYASALNRAMRPNPACWGGEWKPDANICNFRWRGEFKPDYDISLSESITKRVARSRRLPWAEFTRPAAFYQ